MSQENGVWPPSCHDYHRAVHPNRRAIIHRAKMKVHASSRPTGRNGEGASIPDAGMEGAVSHTAHGGFERKWHQDFPAEVHSREPPLLQPVFGSSMRNFHDPFRFNHSSRANCGRGYSGRGMELSREDEESCNEEEVPTR